MAHPAETPVSTAFNSPMNQERLQFMIRDKVKEMTNRNIDRQDAGDLRALMGKVYTNMMADPYRDIQGQVSRMNAQVVREASQTISTGLAQQVKFLQDLGRQPVPLAVPASTSTYGKKIPINNKIGF